MTYVNGVELNEIGILLGQKDPRSVRTYVKPNKRIISKNMDMVEKKLYDKGGPLPTVKARTETKEAKVISITSKISRQAGSTHYLSWP